MPLVSASAALTLAVVEAIQNGTLGNGNVTSQINAQFTYALGAGAGNINQAYIKQRTVSNGTPDVMDLTGTSLLQPDGVTVATFADFVLLCIRNDSIVAGQNLQIGGGTNDITSLLGSSGVEVLLPGFMFLVAGSPASGYALNSSTAHTLNINVAAGSSVPYSVGILGH